MRGEASGRHRLDKELIRELEQLSKTTVKQCEEREECDVKSSGQEDYECDGNDENR